MLLNLLSYVAAIAAFLFVTLSLASGLLWLAEVIEENSKFAKTIGVRAVYVIILLHVALYVFDRLPLRLIAFSIAAHLTYLQNFSTNWPLITLTSPSFLLSCVFVIADHFLWFFYFAHVTQEARQRGRVPRGRLSPYRREIQDTWVDPPKFAEIATFFSICVWLVPLYLFLSLSAMDNALPTANGTMSPKPGHQPVPTPQRTSLVRSLVSFIPISLFQKKRTSGHVRQRSEGLIAPRTPNRSPMLSPAIGTMPLGNWSLSGEDFSESTPPKLAPPPRRVTSDGLGIGMAGSTGMMRVGSTSSLRAGNGSPRPSLNISDSPRGSMDSLDDRQGTNGSMRPSSISNGPRSRNVVRRVTLTENNETASLGGL
ncbi:transmembrane adaptor Erv26 [Ceratobasidium sp. AG-Ba]|nr:transmembrane adaptor Erv26 [Ceratobasidium sp. AG-Ba]QRW02036.1 transmembrane adaptor Erv26 [Ceratobasidium sp. AG-Ba]